MTAAPPRRARGVLPGLAEQAWKLASAVATPVLPDEYLDMVAPLRAGAGSGVYNMARQVGAVIGSAMMAALISSRIAANMGETGNSFTPGTIGSDLPLQAREPLAAAMSQAVLAPAIVIGVAIIVVQFYKRPAYQEA